MLRSALRIVSGAVVLSAGVVAQSPPVWISEVFVNPPGTDGGFELIELTGTPSMPLGGYFLLSIDGDGTSAGVVDQSLDLSALALGGNGVLVWRDAATVLLPAPNPFSTVHVADFVPDLENGSNTFVLGFGTAPSVGVDFDTNNDGVLDGPFSFTVIDAVSIVENDGAANYGYAAQLGYFNAGPFAYTPDAVWRSIDGLLAPSAWLGGDVVGSGTGPFLWEVPLEFFGWGTGVLPPGIGRGVDGGTFNAGAPTQILAQPFGSGSVRLGVAGATPGQIYVSAYTFNALNGPPAPYTGIFGGLEIDLNELLLEYNSFAPPFYGFLDASGAADGLILPAGSFPPLGLTLHGLTIVIDVSGTTVLGQTRIESLLLN
jgi:hypothetical protein